MVKCKGLESSEVLDSGLCEAAQLTSCTVQPGQLIDTVAANF